MAGIIVDIGARTSKLNKSLSSARRRLLNWGKRLTRSMQRIGLNIGRGIVRGIKRGVMAVGAVVTAGIVKSLQTSGQFEKYEAQFEALLGSAEKAKKRIKEIEDVALTVTFDVDSLTQANRHLTVFTENAMAGKDAMKLIADAASVTPNAIEDVAFWFGRAYSMIDAGRPMGEAVMRLREMSLISSEAAKGLAKLEKSYSPTAQAKKLELLIDSLMRFEGANERLISTLPGQMSMFRDAMTYAFREVGDAIAPLTKTYLKELIEKIRELRENGTFKDWGQSVAESIAFVRTKLESFVDLISLYFDNIRKRLETDSIAKIIGEDIGKALGYGIEAAANFLLEYTGAFTEIGITIGKGIAIGVVKGIGSAGNRFLEEIYNNTTPFLGLPKIDMSDPFNVDTSKFEKSRNNFIDSMKFGNNGKIDPPSFSDAANRASGLLNSRKRSGPAEVVIVGDKTPKIAKGGL